MPFPYVFPFIFEPPWNLFPADTLTIGDALAKDVSKPLSDNVALGDDLVKAIHKYLADSVPIRETRYGYANALAITIDHTKVTTLLTDYPIMVYLSAASGQNNDDVSFVFDELQADGNRKKISIRTPDGTECYVEIDQWDDGNEKAWLHVKVSSIASSEDTVLYLYYDILAADNTTYVGDTNSSAAENVWDASFKAVYHMSDGADNAHIYDSTSNNNDGTKKAANEPIQAVGQVGYAQDFDGGDDYIEIADSASLDIDTTITIETIINLEAYSSDSYGYFVNKYDGVGTFAYILLMGGTVSTGRVRFHIGADSIDTYTVLSLATDYYVVGRYTGAKQEIYINGTLDKDGDLTGAIPTNDEPVILGDRGDHNRHHNGTEDEVRISSTNRSEGWIGTTYYTLWDDLLTFGSETPQGVAKDVGKAIAEAALALADSISKEPGLFKSEAAMGITDTLSKEPNLGKADTLTITDAAPVKDVGLGKADTVTITDSIAKDVGLSKADLVTIVDAIAKHMGLSKAEAAMAITDTIVKAIGIIKTETMALADTITTKHIGLGKADTFTIADALAKDVSKPLADAIAILDSLVLTGSYDRPGIKVAAFLFKRAMIAMLYDRDINAKSRREF